MRKTETLTVRLTPTEKRIIALMRRSIVELNREAGIRRPVNQTECVSHALWSWAVSHLTEVQREELEKAES